MNLHPTKEKLQELYLWFITYMLKYLQKQGLYIFLYLKNILHQCTYKRNVILLQIANIYDAIRKIKNIFSNTVDRYCWTRHTHKCIGIYLQHVFLKLPCYSPKWYIHI